MLDFGGAGGVAIVVVRVSVLQCLSPVWLLLSQFNARAATGVQVSVLAVSRTCRTAIYAIRQAMQPADFASLLQKACWLASVLQTLAQFCLYNSSIDSYAAA